MFSTIVVGIDGSEDAERAVSVAGELAGLKPGTAVHVVTACQPLSAADIRAISMELPEEFHPLLHGDMTAEARLDSARGILESAGIEAHYHQSDDNPTDAILDVAEKEEADLVIVGSRGEGLAKRVLHGSVSTKVLHHAETAVLVVRAD